MFFYRLVDVVFRIQGEELKLLENYLKEFMNYNIFKIEVPIKN